MKKLFFFAAAMLAAVTVSAGSVDYTGMTAESDYTIANATLNTSASSDVQKQYNISAGADLTWYKNGAEWAEFHITNTKAKDKIFVVNLNDAAQGHTDKATVEFGGKNGTIYLKGLKVGDVIKMLVACKSAYNAEKPTEGPGALSIVGSDKTTVIGDVLTLPYKDPDAYGIDPDADSNGYIWKTFERTVTSDMFSTENNLVYVKDKAMGFRVKWIQAGAATAIFDAELEGGKAVKTLDENGQIVILKGGKRYNALGAEL